MLDHFACYKVAAAKAPHSESPYPRFTPRIGVTVTDQFSGSLPDQHKLDLKAAKALCNPADKNGEDATAPMHEQHLEAYAAKLTKLDPPQPKPASHVTTIANQFGQLKLTVKKPDRVMVPSAKVIGTTPPAPLAAPTVDHFKCYKVSVAKAPKDQPPYPTWLVQTVSLTDQLQGPRFFDLTAPKHLCTPADKNGEDVTAPTHPLQLVCYKAKLTKLEPAQAAFVAARVATTNQFGSEVVNAKALEELCVPSLMY